MKNLRSWIATATVAALLGGLLAVVPTIAQPDAAQAAVASDFTPGNIISDEKFYDGAAMSVSEIQNFLNSKVAVCRAGYTCLKDFRQTTSGRAGNEMCAAYVGLPNETAAQIIYKVGVACGISQQAMLVLLEKEQRLVSDDWPYDIQYRSATGYGCPDTAPCDAQYYGFYNQVYKAAWQFKYYKAYPNSYNHVPGRINQVRFHPNASCGTSSVFIQNSATAGLYNYTPYQPNDAALGNLYGTGDVCSSYGNRNFWRMFSDWFGSPTGPSSLVRTASNATVYVTSGALKYPIASQAVLSAYSSLGPVNYVTDSYLAKFSTAQSATQVLRGPDGSIYFTGAGIKLPFMSCETVAHYGGSCSATGYVQLDASQISKFVTGPLLTRMMGTVEGSRYFLENGAKREILDEQSQAQIGATGAMNVLTESALSGIPMGVPVARPSVAVTQFNSSEVSLLDAVVNRWPVGAADAASWNLVRNSAGRLRAESLAKLPQSGAPANGFMSDPTGQAFGLGGGKKFKWTPPAGTTIRTTPVSSAFLDTYPTSAEIGVGSFVKTPESATIYLITDPLIRPIGSWETLVSMSDLGNPTYSVVPQALVSSLQPGPVALEAGTLVRSEADATVFVINGITNKLPLSSFDPATEAGLTRFSFTSQDRITAYPRAEKVLEYGVSCDAKRYLSAGGSIHLVPDSLTAAFPFDYLELDKYVCRQLSVGTAATEFIRTPDGSIYMMDQGQKRPIGSMSRFAELDPSGTGFLNVSSRFGASIPTGSAM